MQGETFDLPLEWYYALIKMLSYELGDIWQVPEDRMGRLRDARGRYLVRDRNAISLDNEGITDSFKRVGAGVAAAAAAPAASIETASAETVLRFMYVLLPCRETARRSGRIRPPATARIRPCEFDCVNASAQRKAPARETRRTTHGRRIHPDAWRARPE